MSAFYAVAYSDRVELVTDGAIYADDGTILETREKVWRSHRLPLAFAGRGDSLAVEFTALALQTLSVVGSVTDCLERFAGTLRRNRKTLAKPIDGIIASVSEAGIPKLHWFTTYEGFEGLEPFQLYDVGDQWGGGPSPSSDALVPWGFPERMETESLAQAGADLFEVFRQTTMEHLAHPDKPVIYGVGGHVDLTVIDAAGARTSRLRTWPEDVPGRKIEPLAMAA